MFLWGTSSRAKARRKSVLFARFPDRSSFYQKGFFLTSKYRKTISRFYSFPERANPFLNDWPSFWRAIKTPFSEGLRFHRWFCYLQKTRLLRGPIQSIKWKQAHNTSVCFSHEARTQCCSNFAIRPTRDTFFGWRATTSSQDHRNQKKKYDAPCHRFF